MNYSGNMPDWHQFNTSQTNEVSPGTQNVNSGHLGYIPGVSPTSYNAINLGSEGIDKHQNDTNFNLRHYQSMNNASGNPSISNNTPLTSMLQMQNCIGHYGSVNARNPMLDNLNAPVDPRNTTVSGINDDVAYRSNQVPFNGSITHLNGPNCNINSTHGSGPIPGSVPVPISGSCIGSRPATCAGPSSVPIPGSGAVHNSGHGTAQMGPRNTNIGSVPSGRSGSIIPCKALCCNPDPNTSYQQWEKFGQYQTNTSYRDNIRPSGYQTENRRFGNNYNFRKDHFESKEPLGHMFSNTSNVDHRRNFVDYKYHKEHLIPRNYPTSTGMVHNYPVQNYNYTGDYQKYPYPIKEHPKTNGMNVSNPEMIKHPEQNFVGQQKYNNKSVQYQNPTPLPKNVSALNVNPNVISSSHNTYFNQQYARNVPAEMSHECQESTNSNTVGGRLATTYMHGTHSRYQVYQQKLAMQKFSMENNLKELSRIPGYQSHPKYKEYMFRYREILKLQESIAYQNQVQQSSCVPTSMNATVPPINLQFDQNGMLINSSYISDSFNRIEHATNPEQPPENLEKQNTEQRITSEKSHQEVRRPEQVMKPLHSEHVATSNPEDTQKPNQFAIKKDFCKNQLQPQQSKDHNAEALSVESCKEIVIQQKTSKDFANKPELDVRQFLANWDETDDEEGTVSNVSDTVLSDSTPVVVVSYENINIATKSPENSEISSQSKVCTNATSTENEQKSSTDVLAPQDCLTISYSSPENSEVVKNFEQAGGESIVKPGSIIHCISNGPDEIPTIHIVDNLEISNILDTSNEQIIETLESQKTVSFFPGSTTADVEGSTLPITENKSDDSSHLSPERNAPLDGTSKETHVEDPDVSESAQTIKTSLNDQELQTLSISSKDNLDPNQSLNLKKQNSFASEESHHPDDISLPDLPTSECTPISTTLNTPIQSDSEESSEQMEDLTISTNPIEIMQNSPVISFTQSPVKLEPYGQLNNGQTSKERTTGTLELEFSNQSHFKAGSTDNAHEDDITLNDFNFPESTETMQNSKENQNSGNGSTRKKELSLNVNKDDNDYIRTSPIASAEYELQTATEQIQNPTLRDDRGSSIENLNTNEPLKSIDMTARESIGLSAASPNPVCTNLERSSSTGILSTTETELASTVTSGNGKNREKDYTASQKEGLYRKLVTSKEILNDTGITDTDTTILTTYSSTGINVGVGKKRKQSSIWEDGFLGKDFSKVEKDRPMKMHKGNSENSKGYHVTSAINDDDRHGETISRSAADGRTGTTISQRRHSCEFHREQSPELDKSPDITDARGFSKEAELKRSALHGAGPHEDLHSENHKKSRIMEKNLRSVERNIKYKKDDMRRLKAYRRRKDKICIAHDVPLKHKDSKVISEHNRDQKDIFLNVSHENVPGKICEDSQLARRKTCYEQNDLPLVHRQGTAEEDKRISFGQNFLEKSKTPDFGIQVTNVNLKIKDNEIRKEVLLGDKQEHIKDSLDGIKIEINVSCTDRNAKSMEYNKKLLCQNLRKRDERDMYDVNTSYSHRLGVCSPILDSCQCQSYTKESKKTDNKQLFDKTHKTPEHSSVIMRTVPKETEKETNDTEVTPGNEDVFTRNRLNAMCNLNSIKCLTDQTCNIQSNASSKSIICHKAIAESKVRTIRDVDDSFYNQHITGNEARPGSGQNNKCANLEDNAAGKVQAQAIDLTTSSDPMSEVQLLSKSLNMERSIERETAESSHLSKNEKISSDSNSIIVNPRSLSTLSTMDFNIEPLHYENYLDINEDVEFNDNNAVKWRRSKMDTLRDYEMFESTKGYINPIFSSIDQLDDMHTVPVYTTKDGKISYSPNRRFWSHKLLMDTYKWKERSTTDKLDTDYDSSKFRKLNKSNRNFSINDKRKQVDLKDMMFFYECRRNYLSDLYDRDRINSKDLIGSINNYNTPYTRGFIHCSSEDTAIQSNSKCKQVIDTNNHEECNVNTNNDKVIDSAEESGLLTYDELHKDKVVTGDINLLEKNMPVVIYDVENNTSCGETEPTLVLSPSNHKGGNDVCDSVSDSIVTNPICQHQRGNNIHVSPMRSDNICQGSKVCMPCSQLEDHCRLDDDKQPNEKAECTMAKYSESLNNNSIDKLTDTNTIYEHSKREEVEHFSQGRNIKNIENMSPNECSREEKAICSSPSGFDNKNLTYSLVEDITECTNIENFKSVFNEDNKISEEVTTDDETVNNKNVVEREPQKLDAARSDIGLDNIDIKEDAAGLLTSHFDKNFHDLNGSEELMPSNTEVEYNGNIHAYDIKNHIKECDTTKEINDTKKMENTSDQNKLEKLDTIPSVSLNKMVIESTLPLDFLQDNSNESCSHIQWDDNSENESIVTLVTNKDIASADNKIPVLSIHDEIGSTFNEDIKLETGNTNNSLSSSEAYSNINYTHASDYNTDGKPVPKSVIKKAENPNSKAESTSNNMELMDNVNRYDSKFVPTVHLKIPKMIITKAGLRSITPSCNAVENEHPERTQSPVGDSSEVTTDTDDSDSEPPKIKANSYESKVPKVTIRLDDISTKDLKLNTQRKDIRKTVPKMKIRRMKSDSVSSEESHTPPPTIVKFEALESTSRRSTISDGFVCDKETLSESHITDSEKLDKIPKLKLRRHEEDNSPSPNRVKRKQDVNCEKSSAKKSRRLVEEDVRSSTKYDNATQMESEVKKESTQCVSEKVPKVIIKRSQAGAEFKCEFSKAENCCAIESTKWQPKVKLQRLQILDRMVRNLKHSTLSLRHTSLKDIHKILNNDPSNSIRDDIYGNHTNLGAPSKLSRSNSTSNLPSIKYKQRRLSDGNYIEVMDSLTKVNTVPITKRNATERHAGRNFKPASKEISLECKNKYTEHSEFIRKKPLFRRINVIDDDSDDEVELNVDDQIQASSASEKESKEKLLSNIPSRIEDNKTPCVKQQYIDFDDNESALTAEDKLLKSDGARSHRFDDNDTSVIKVDSSDESQTTIEMLPASPDSSQNDLEVRQHTFDSSKSGKLYLQDAIPTQLELELEVMDNNNIESSDLLISKANEFRPDRSNSTCTEKYAPSSHLNSDKIISTGSMDELSYGKPVTLTAASTAKSRWKMSSEDNARLAEKYFYCNDLLVKEVLAAKETLKKCLSRSDSEIMKETQSRTKTPAEKKQGLGFDFRNITKTMCTPDDVQHSRDISEQVNRKLKPKASTQHVAGQKLNVKKINKKYTTQDKCTLLEKRVKFKMRRTREDTAFSIHCSTATCTDVTIEDSTTISLKTSKQLGRISTNETLPDVMAVPDADHRSNEASKNNATCGVEKYYVDAKVDDQTVSSKNIQDIGFENPKSLTADGIKGNKIKEDNMPVLEPEVSLNFDPSSDRDSSRSPPVITNQDSIDNRIAVAKDNAMKLEENKKHPDKDSEMTVADIIRQLAYHEKATIKHRRYCNLCERWFPTTARHRRHLSGYQHRHTELMQRKSIHALFILFTGKPCPRLLPANITRNDCSVGELTPLQIAVQDVAKCTESTKQDLIKKE